MKNGIQFGAVSIIGLLILIGGFIAFPKILFVWFLHVSAGYILIDLGCVLKAKTPRTKRNRKWGWIALIIGMLLVCSSPFTFMYMMRISM